MNISKQAVLELLNETPMQASHFIALMDKINLLPSISDGWISVAERTPELIKGENYSENVYAICNGELDIMCYCYIPGDDGGFVWATCNGDIYGDAEFDDNYDVTDWQPLPPAPTK